MVFTKYKQNQLLPAGFDDNNQQKNMICVPKTDGCKGCGFQGEISCKGHSDRCGDMILIQHEKKTSFTGGAGRPA